MTHAFEPSFVGRSVRVATLSSALFSINLLVTERLQHRYFLLIECIVDKSGVIIVILTGLHLRLVDYGKRKMD